MDQLFSQKISTPLGTLKLLGTSSRLTGLLFENEALPAGTVDHSTKVLQDVAVEITEYFNGERTDFSLSHSISITREGFSGQIQHTLLDIPYACTWTYSQLATAAGFEGAARAAGTACRRNPLPIIIPCHRVIRADGTSGHYRGGDEAKKWLLNWEQDIANNSLLGNL